MTQAVDTPHTEGAGGAPVIETGVLIVGAGFSGIALGAELKRRGVEDFRIVERGGGFGGTWYHNTYPGAECDIQSHLYSFSFHPNPNWTKTYATQPEILDYLDEVAKDEGLSPHASFDEAVTDARFDEEAAHWDVTTTRARYRARFVVFATGHLSDPKLPDLPGIEDFEGRSFHSATWDHDYDLAGKRVAVVGTGASAIQVVPAIADDAGSVTVYQRSAPYVVPRRDTVYSEEQKQTFARSPEAMAEFREFLFWSNEQRFLQRMMVPEFLGELEETARAHREAQISDPELLEKVTPTFTAGCKRTLVSNTWYPALQRDDVELVDRGVKALTATGVVDADGVERAADCVVFCSGFEAAELPIAQLVHGPAGLLADQWTSGSEAFGGMAVAGYPNLFLLNGPHVGLGAGSIIFMVETQARYVAEAVEHAADNGISSLEVRRERQDEFVDHVDERARGTVWNTEGCDAWYLDERSGKLTTIWPDQMNRYRALFGTFNPDDYREATAPAAAGT
ncbi:flavin-containing monooxygenase [Corynebacterium otitidis]